MSDAELIDRFVHKYGYRFTDTNDILIPARRLPEIIDMVRATDRAGTGKQADCKAMAKAMYQKQCEYVGRDHEGKCVEMLETAFLSFEADIHAQRAKTIEAVLAAMDNIDWDSEIEEGQNLRLLRQAVELEIKGVGDDS
jgi:hypothetical protein